MAEGASRSARRLFVEGTVIVTSILLAFGIEASWQFLLERRSEDALLTDLLAEFEGNRDRLATLVDRQAQRGDRIRAVMQSAMSSDDTLSMEGVQQHARRILANPEFRPETGVLDRAEAGNALEVIRDADLRASIAGFWSSSSFFANQESWVPMVSAPEVLFETGSYIWPPPEGAPEALLPDPWSQPLSREQENAFRFLSAAVFVSDLLVFQGTALLGETELIIERLREAIGG